MRVRRWVGSSQTGRWVRGRGDRCPGKNKCVVRTGWYRLGFMRAFDCWDLLPGLLPLTLCTSGLQRD